MIKKFNGHMNIGKSITVYGDNAMHYAVEIYTMRFGYICFRPTTGSGKWKWYFYVSPNATTWASTFAVGPGISRRDKQLSKVRRMELGHNFDTESQWEALRKINA